MYKHKTFLGLIPARKGSKRLPHKNILNLNGKPLLAWTVEAAVNSKYIDEVIISTDDLKIAEIGKKFGAKVPFLRPTNFATESSSSVELVVHAVDYYKKKLKKKFDYVVLLQPTSPLRDSHDIDNAIEYLAAKKADAVISLSEIEHSLTRSNILPENLSLVNFIGKEFKDKRNQDLPKYFTPNGAIYIHKTSVFLKEQTFFIRRNIFGFIMPIEKSVDIDTKLDFDRAELLMKQSVKKYRV